MTMYCGHCLNDISMCPADCPGRIETGMIVPNPLPPLPDGWVRCGDGTVKIPIGHGAYAIVDADSCEALKGVKWSSNGRGYAQRHISYPTDGRRRKKAKLKMHRIIAGAAPGQLVDHINGDKLDNRRCNLRIVTKRQNNTNKTSSPHQKNGAFKGVQWVPEMNKWRAHIAGGAIKPDGCRRKIHLGYFADPVEAAKAYDAKAIELFGEYAGLNFPSRLTVPAEVRGLT